MRAQSSRYQAHTSVLPILTVKAAHIIHQSKAPDTVIILPLLLHFFLGLIGKVQSFYVKNSPFWVVWYPPFATFGYPLEHHTPLHARTHQSSTA